MALTREETIAAARQAWTYPAGNGQFFLSAAPHPRLPYDAAAALASDLKLASFG